MALALTAAGSARAYDATRVIYDLSDLRVDTYKSSAPAGRTSSFSAPVGNLPIATPSLGHGSGDGNFESDTDGNLLLDTNHGHVGHLGSNGSPRGGGPTGNGNGGNGDNGKGGRGGNNPTPNPEPGTILLLGSGLAAGARYLRRRAQA
jgi:hypothetical protein